MTTETTIQAALQGGEKAYPIYEINVYWTQAVMEEKDLPPRMTEGLPEGRFRNHASWRTMKRESSDLETIRREVIDEWWPQYIEKKQLPTPAELKVSVILLSWEVWCGGWFSHWTYDVGMADEQVLDSFERYVARHAGNQGDGTCLMGAEDRWRWHGCATGDPQGERTPPPCRCEHCTRNGIVRIDH